MDKRKHILLGVGLIALTVVFYPVVLWAATDASDTTGSTSNEPSTALSRSIEAGKAVSKRALSSKAKEADAEAVQTKPTKIEKTEPTAFQKKMAAIAQGETSSTENTLSDFATQASPAVKNASTVKKTDAVKKADATKDQEAEAEKIPMAEMTTKGTVTGVSPQGFALEYGIDKKAGSMEIWFNYNDGIKFSGMGSAGELGEGDTVFVVYDQAPNKVRIVKEMTLLKKKPKETEGM
jgi:hypothetical protein